MSAMATSAIASVSLMHTSNHSMTPPRIAIAFTTINRGEIISNLAVNLLKHGHADRVTIYAIPDVSTPDEFYTTCRHAVEKGVNVIFPTMNEQQAFLSSIPVCPEIPTKTDNRRNVGFLMALRDQVDYLLSIDDDNFFDADTDFITAHEANMSSASAGLPVIESSNRFYNNCHPLRVKVNVEVYPRGYPLSLRHQPVTYAECPADRLPTWINAGLWIESPDIDAFEWLSCGQTVRSDGWEEQNMRLGPSTWCPVNSQNTMLARELIDAYYFLPMRSTQLELPIDRHGDILSGYFALKCAKVHGATVNFGSPVARHIRNQHDYAKDFRREMLFLAVLDEFLDWLMHVDIRKGTMIETYADLASKLDDQIESFTDPAWTKGLKSHFHEMARCMHQWTEAVRYLQGPRA